MKGKSCPWGIKNFLLCSSKGMVYDMLLYQGKITEIDLNFLKKYGLGASVVLKLVESLEKNKHFLFFDNFFRIKSAGTIRLNRFPKIPIIGDKDLTKLGRGTPDIVKRFDKKEKRYTDISRPEIVRLYRIHSHFFHEFSR
ncbi:piggyBac transposable element-derived protein 3-like [Aphis craccivora]|uniref:PiggyBac transposable element-derived protein 3-like n=1 Tax=Aphis craccivora TaxID=307492 RepID=A0A6G0VIV4_APHCR|nr:piggyBac transposable element-derived protein 3-like [Aphis craccivora]